MRDFEDFRDAVLNKISALEVSGVSQILCLP